MNTTSSFSEYALITDAADRGRVAQLEPLFLIVRSAKGTGTQGKVLAECAAQAGMKRKTFQNHYYAWRDHGVMGCADKRKVAKVHPIPAIIPVYKTYLEKFKGQTGFYAAAYRRMMADFRMGHIFPGIGTWREAWRIEFPDRPIPVRCPTSWTPWGGSYANLLEILKRTRHIWRRWRGTCGARVRRRGSCGT